MPKVNETCVKCRTPDPEEIQKHIDYVNAAMQMDKEEMAESDFGYMVGCTLNEYNDFIVRDGYAQELPSLTMEDLDSFIRENYRVNSAYYIEDIEEPESEHEDEETYEFRCK